MNEEGESSYHYWYPGEARVIAFFHQESIKFVRSYLLCFSHSFILRHFRFPNISIFFRFFSASCRSRKIHVKQYLYNEFEMMLGVDGGSQDEEEQKRPFYPFVFSFLYVIMLALEDPSNHRTY